MGTFRVSNTAQLNNAIGSARAGDTILLAQGNYGKVTIKDFAGGTGVKITSADASRPAHINQLDVSKSSGLSFTNLDIGRGLIAGERYDITAMVRVRDSSNITLDRVAIHGSLDGNPQNDGLGMLLNGNTNLKVTNADFQQLWRAMSIGGGKNIEVSNSSFTKLRMDGITAAATDTLLIDGNRFSDFSLVRGDHPDAIQMWTSGTTQSAKNITIKNNVIMEGAGAGMQGIFLRDELGTKPYQNVSIDNNLIYTSTFSNGITVDGVNGLNIKGNTVLSPKTDSSPTWIRVAKATAAIVQNNVASSIVVPDRSPVQLTNNAIMTRDLWINRSLTALSQGLDAPVESLVLAGIGYQPPGAPVRPPNTVRTLFDMRATSSDIVDGSDYESALTYTSGALVRTSSGYAFQSKEGNTLKISRFNGKQMLQMDAFTLSFSMQRDSSSRGSGVIMRMHGGMQLKLTNAGEFELQLTNTDGAIVKLTTSGADVSDRDLHTVAFTYDSSKSKVNFYVDRRLVGQTSFTGQIGTATTHELSLGNVWAGAAFNGKLSNVKVLDQAVAPGTTNTAVPLPVTPPVQGVIAAPTAAAVQRSVALGPDPAPGAANVITLPTLADAQIIPAQMPTATTALTSPVPSLPTQQQPMQFQPAAAGMIGTFSLARTTMDYTIAS